MHMNEAYIWEQFAQKYQLSENQLQACQKYYQLLQLANSQFDLTAITDLSSSIAYHFADSLAITSVIDFSNIRMIADVGTGAGFPGLVLKIKYPHLSVILIEVLTKRVEFLKSVIDALSLHHDVILYTNDWRTFLRKTSYPVDLVCARASLPPRELVRMFQPSSSYNRAQLAYWASAGWEPEGKEAELITQVANYEVKDRRRKYVIFQQKN